MISEHIANVIGMRREIYDTQAGVGRGSTQQRHTMQRDLGWETGIYNTKAANAKESANAKRVQRECQ